MIKQFWQWQQKHPFAGMVLGLVVSVVGMFVLIPWISETMVTDGPAEEGTGTFWDPRWTHCGLKVKHTNEGQGWLNGDPWHTEISVPPQFVNQTLLYASNGQHVAFTLAAGSENSCGRASILTKLEAIP